MRAAALALVVAALAGCGGDPEPRAAPDAPRTAVRITYDADRSDGVPGRTVALECPSQGNALACRTLTSLPEDVLAGVPPDVACIELYAGPQTGRIVGVIEGRRVDARFSRSNGCETDRFDRAEQVLAIAR